MPTPSAETKFIGVIPPANTQQKRSALINGYSEGYTAAEIAEAGGTGIKDYWFLNSSTYAQHDDFIDKSFYNFKVWSAGTEMITGGTITITDYNATGIGSNKAILGNTSITHTQLNGMVLMNGTTSSYPALKQSGTKIEVRKADDSDYGDFKANNVRSGSYTPTITGVTNVSSSIAYTLFYTRVDSVVTVSGQVSITSTANNAQTTFGISLPVASNFTSTGDVGGGGYTQSNSIAGHGLSFSGDATNDRVNVDYYESHTSPDVFNFTFSYKIK